MNFPTWEQLIDFHCHKNRVKINDVLCWNKNYESFANRRYNFSNRRDTKICRFIFLNSVLKNPTNKTLVRDGRFIWCEDLVYEGLGEDGLRHISFSIEKGKKRFIVSEKDMLCIPSKSFVNNHKFFRSKEKVFKGFSSALSYENTLKMMAKSANCSLEDISNRISLDNPYKPGTLVSPRIGYFYPMTAQPHIERPPLQEIHPCGVILGKSFKNNTEYGREFYRVRFGNVTYENIHPVQVEIISEV